MENHPIENLMKNTLENIKEMIDVNTIIGDAVETKDGSVIIPISKVSFGFASGGSEFSATQTKSDTLKYPFGGGGGAGVSVKPVAFLVMKHDNVRLLSLDHDNSIDRIVDHIPQLMDIFNEKCKSKQQADPKPSE